MGALAIIELADDDEIVSPLELVDGQPRHGPKSVTFGAGASRPFGGWHHLEEERMALQIVGSDRPAGFDVLDTETGESVLRKLGARRLRLVLDNEGARLEIDSHIAFDHTVPGEVRAFMGCPVTGEQREVRAVEYADGGRVTYPRDFSSGGGAP